MPYVMTHDMVTVVWTVNHQWILCRISMQRRERTPPESYRISSSLTKYFMLCHATAMQATSTICTGPLSRCCEDLNGESNWLSITKTHKLQLHASAQNLDRKYNCHTMLVRMIRDNHSHSADSNQALTKSVYQRHFAGHRLPPNSGPTSTQQICLKDTCMGVSYKCKLFSNVHHTPPCIFILWMSNCWIWLFPGEYLW